MPQQKPEITAELFYDLSHEILDVSIDGHIENRRTLTDKLFVLTQSYAKQEIEKRLRKSAKELPTDVDMRMFSKEWASIFQGKERLGMESAHLSGQQRVREQAASVLAGMEQQIKDWKYFAGELQIDRDEKTKEIKDWHRLNEEWKSKTFQFINESEELNKQLSEKDKQLAEKDREIKELKADAARKSNS